jgi:hypothetical protein
MHEHDVFGLDVSMEYLVLVHESNRIQQVADDEGGGFFRESLSSGDDIEELSVAAELHDDVEVLLIAEAAVDLDDVGVVEEALDLQFPQKLHEKVVPDDALLLNHLQAQDHPRPDLPRQVNAAELALAQPPDHLEALLRQPLLLLELGRRLGLVAQERREGALRLVGCQAVGVGRRGGFLQLAGPAAGPAGAEELRLLGVAGALAEDLGAAHLLHQVPAVRLLSPRVAARQVLRGPGIIHFLEVFFRLMALEGRLPETKLAEFHLGLGGDLGRVGRSVDDEAAAEGLSFAALPAKGRTAAWEIAMHE